MATAFEERDPKTILYENRTLFLVGEITENAEMGIIPMLMALDALGSDPITLYIDSPGGCVTAGLAIYDAMQYIKAPVHTVCMGTAASMAAWLLAGGAPGNRCATENSSIMIHQGRTSIGGRLSDLRTSMEQFTRIERRMCQLLARHTGKTADEIEAACRLDFWMTPEEALDFGIIDRVARPDTAKFASGRHSRK